MPKVPIMVGLVGLKEAFYALEKRKISKTFIMGIASVPKAEEK